MKTNHILIFFLSCIILFPSGLFGLTFQKRIASNFTHQWAVSQPEKCYLHTDKPYYCVGEKIWLKGYVVSAVTHFPKSLSRFLYVELLDQSGNLVQRVKIKRDSVGFAGCLQLSTTVQTGVYSIRAYTNWMQNSGSDYFFYKKISIVDMIDNNVSSSISFSTEKRGRYNAVVLLKNNSGNPLTGKTIDVCQGWDNPSGKRQMFKSDNNGKIVVPLILDSTNRNANYFDLSINESSLKFNHRFFVPNLSTDFDLQFMPESGSLLSGQLQIVGFKAIGSDGFGVNVTGVVYNSKNEEVTDFSTMYKGMGKFTMQVDSGETYYAIVKSQDNVTKRFKLPSVRSNGVTLHLVYNKAKVLYEVINKSLVDNGALCLLLHQRGKLLAMFPLKELQGQISDELLPSGIVSLSVVDTLGHVYCERLHFVRGKEEVGVNMVSDKPFYGRRLPVDLNFKISLPSGEAATGSYSLSVVDKVLVKEDSLNSDILINLLLTSDLKGYVEAPSSYFTTNLLLDRERLDVLLITQGWKRFSIQDIVNGVFKEPKFYMEVGQAVSGRVVGLFNKPSKKCGVIMISSKTGKIKVTNTDSLGRFMIDGIDFPDSTSLILKAKKEKSFGDVELIPDKDDFPGAFTFIPWREKQEMASIPSDYLWQSKQRYYTDGSMRMVDLEGVTVKAKKIDNSQDVHFYSGMEDRKIDQKRLDQYPGMGVLDLLSMEPGVQVIGDQVSIRGGRDNPTFYIDDIEAMSIDEVKYLNSDDIQDISIFKGAGATIFGSKGGNGVIAIALKKGVVHKEVTAPSLVNITPLGYQKHIEFYVPKYDVETNLKSEKQDLRTTIFWAPELVPDSLGNIHVRFFTADKVNNYSVTLEGVSEKGEICHYKGIIERRAEN